MKTLPSPSKGAPTAISVQKQCQYSFKGTVLGLGVRTLGLGVRVRVQPNNLQSIFKLFIHYFALTSISVLVKISNTAHRHSKHGIVGPIETDGPSLIIPVAKGVQVDVYSPTNLSLTVKEVWSSNNQIRPTKDRNSI